MASDGSSDFRMNVSRVALFIDTFLFGAGRFHQAREVFYRPRCSRTEYYIGPNNTLQSRSVMQSQSADPPAGPIDITKDANAGTKRTKSGGGSGTKRTKSGGGTVLQKKASRRRPLKKASVEWSESSEEVESKK